MKTNQVVKTKLQVPKGKLGQLGAVQPAHVPSAGQLAPTHQGEAAQPAGTDGISACCGAEKQVNCCQPAAKATCCGPQSTSGSCGCQ